MIEDRDSLEIVSVSEDSDAPLQGVLTVPASLDEASQITYRDASGHIGEEHFLYTVRDLLSGEESSGTVYLIPGSGAYIATLQQTTNGVSDGQGLRLATRGNFELLSGIEHENFRAELSVYREGWETPMLSLMNRSRMVNSGGDSWSSREIELQLSDSPSINYRYDNSSWHEMKWKSVWDAEDGVASWNHPAELSQGEWARWRLDVQGEEVSISYSDDGTSFTVVDQISVSDYARQNGVLDLVFNTGGGEQAVILDQVRVVALDSDGQEAGEELLNLDFESETDLQNFLAYWGELDDPDAEPQMPLFEVTDVEAWVRLYGRVREDDNGTEWVESAVGEQGSNLLVRNSTGVLSQAIDSDKPIYVSEVALDPNQENLYVSLSGKGEWWRDGWWNCPTCDDYRNDARIIGEQGCALFKVDLVSGASQCVIENVLPVPMLGKQDRVSGVSSLQFDQAGNLYFAAAPFDVEVSNRESEWASYELRAVEAGRPIYLYQVDTTLSDPADESGLRYYSENIESMEESNWRPKHSFSYRVLNHGVVVLHQRSSKDYSGSDIHFWEDWEEDSRIHLISENGLTSIEEIDDVRAIFSDGASSLIVVPHDDNAPPMLLNVEHDTDTDSYKLVAVGGERNTTNYKYSVGAILDGGDAYHISGNGGLEWLLNPEGKADVRTLDISNWSIANLFRRELAYVSDGMLFHADNREDESDLDAYGDLHKVSRYSLDDGSNQEMIADENLLVDRLLNRNEGGYVLARMELPAEGLSSESTWKPYVASLLNDAASAWEFDISGSRDAMKISDLLVKSSETSSAPLQTQLAHSPLSLDALALDVADGVVPSTVTAELTHTVTGHEIELVPLVSGNRIFWALESDSDLTNRSSTGLVTNNSYSLVLGGGYTHTATIETPPERGWMVDSSELIYWAGESQNEWIVELTPDSSVGDNVQIEFNALKGSDSINVTYWDQQADYDFYGRLVEWRLGDNWADWRGSDQSSLSMRYSDDSCANCGSWGETIDTVLSNQMRRYRLQILNNEVSTWISEDGGATWLGDESGELDALQSYSLTFNGGATIARSGDEDYRVLLGATDKTRISDLSITRLDSGGEAIETTELIGDEPSMDLFTTEWTVDQWLDERW